jgi:heme exporter protein D
MPDNVAAFFDMGGHGLYVWSSYFIALLIFAWNVVQPLRRRRQVVAEHRRRLTREATVREATVEEGSE